MRPKEKTRINPFTGKRVPRRVVPGEFYLHEDGDILGTIELDEEFEQNGELIVWTQTRPNEHVTFVITGLRARIEWCYEDGDFSE